MNYQSSSCHSLISAEFIGACHHARSVMISGSSLILQSSMSFWKSALGKRCAYGLRASLLLEYQGYCRFSSLLWGPKPLLLAHQPALRKTAVRGSSYCPLCVCVWWWWGVCVWAHAHKCPGWPQMHYIAGDDFELPTLLLLPPKCCDYRCVLPHLLSEYLGKNQGYVCGQASCLQTKL